MPVRHAEMVSVRHVEMAPVGHVETAPVGDAELVGREPELDRIDQFLEGTTTALLLAGEAGIGKTVLWRAATRRATDRGWRVLSAQPAQPEAQLSYATLGDLLVDVLDAAAESIPAPQRAALESALLLRPMEGAAPYGRAVGLAVLATLRASSVEAPLLVAVDDVQWMDRASAAALEFALRRLPPDRVRAIVTCRTEALATGQPLGAGGTRIDVGPLSFGAVHRLLTESQGAPINHPLARRLHEMAHGNPLHALELARALERHGPWTPDTFTPSPDLAELVRARLVRLPESTQRMLRFLSAMSQPTRDLLHAAIPTADTDGDLDRAIAAGLISRHGDRVRFAHPLFASACYRAAPTVLRRETHARLAEVTTHEEARARHLAVAAAGPDTEVADAVELGAAHARRRGAPYAAAELADLARVLTPAADNETLQRRTLETAHYLMEAGEAARARNLLEDHLSSQAPGPQRVRAMLGLSAVLFEEDGLGPMREVATQALDEAGDDPLALGEAHLAIAERSQLPGADALRHAEKALTLLEGRPEAGPDLLAKALRDVAIARWQMGQGMARDLISRAAELEAGLPLRQPVAWRARTCMGECLKYDDQFDEADAILAESEDTAEREGDVSSLVDIAGHRAELLLWLGRWVEADSYATQAVESALLTEQRGRIAIASHFRSLVRTHRGQLDQARIDAERAIDEGTRCHDFWAATLGHWALGVLALSTGDGPTAAPHFAVCHEFASSGEFCVPRQWRFLGDNVEALVIAGDLETAAARLDELRDWSASMGTGWARATCARATGLFREASGDRDAALEALAAALQDHESLPLPFEHARTLLALGSVQRRAGRRRVARAALESALELFTTLGAPLWIERTRQQLAGISGRTRTVVELTASEQRVAELVAAGMSNKQVAAALVVTPRTVEAHLTRIYAKLGVRSRVELATRYATLVPEPPASIV